MFLLFKSLIRKLKKTVFQAHTVTVTTEKQLINLDW